ncbi:glutathione-S-transferase [Cristinia sonorae]|uniref:Glutathione-S-transferase n=1 Tax=Cristinia sonorae TaxID=1940300 RepID=A0A8K0UG96_9AGAR|nr:glutathione-S-transferase [Cristinia sonorae]
MGVPDEHIHPVATGVAAQTVAKHQEPQDLIFYAGWFCPYVQRTWIALEERGIPYQYKEVNPYKKEKHFLEINPKGLVPAVEYQGKALYKSLILTEFLEDAYPEYKPNILPKDPYTRAYVRIWVDYISKTIVPASMRLTQAQDPEKRKEYLQELLNAQRKLGEQVKGPYFLGEEFSLVDVALAPWIVRDWISVKHRGYRREDAGEAFKNYADNLAKRPSVINTSSDEEHYIPIYDRYLRDEAQSEAAKAVRQGRDIP